MLAAVMFTDMVGYTALMQENEQKAKENRDRHRKILQDAVTRHQGKILQYYGDGTLYMMMKGYTGMLSMLPQGLKDWLYPGAY